MKFIHEKTYHDNWQNGTNSASVTITRGDRARIYHNISMATWMRINRLESLARIEYLNNPEWFPGVSGKFITVTIK